MVGGALLEGLGLILLFLSLTSESKEKPLAMLIGGIALTSIGGLGTMIGIFKAQAARKGGPNSKS